MVTLLLTFEFDVRINETSSLSVPKLILRHLPRHFEFVCSSLFCLASSRRFNFLTEFYLRPFPLLHTRPHESELDQSWFASEIQSGFPCDY